MCIDSMTEFLPVILIGIFFDSYEVQLCMVTALCAHSTHMGMCDFYSSCFNKTHSGK